MLLLGRQHYFGGLELARAAGWVNLNVSFPQT
jgi:hypothetical protein